MYRHVLVTHGPPEDDDAALEAGRRNLSDWRAELGRRRCVYPLPPVAGSQLRLCDPVELHARFLAAGGHAFDDWLAQHPLTAAEIPPIDWRLQDLAVFERHERDARRTWREPTPVVVVEPDAAAMLVDGIVVSDDEDESQADEDYGGHLPGRGAALLLHPRCTPDAMGPLPAPQRIRRARVHHAFVDAAELEAALAETKRAFFILPVWLPADAPLPVSLAARPVWPSADGLAGPRRPDVLPWSADALVDVWTLVVNLARAGHMGRLDAFVAEDEQWGEHVRLWCDAYLALRLRELLRSTHLGDALLPLFDAGGRPLLVA